MPAAPGNAPAQISDTLSYAAPASVPAGTPAPGDATSAPGGKKTRTANSSSATGQATTDPAQSAPPHDLIHLIGNFFRKLFGRG